MKILTLLFVLVFGVCSSFSQEADRSYPLVLVAPIGWGNVQLVDSGRYEKEYERSLDAIIKSKSNIFAIESGIVKEKTIDTDGTNTIRIASSAGIEMIYTKLLDCQVKGGEKIKRGDRIGSIGLTSISIKPILLLLSDKIVDSISYFSYNSFLVRIQKRTPVYSILSGDVSSLGYDEVTGYGMYLDVDSQTLKTQYRYLGSFNTQRQAHVLQGALIAYTGMTGMIEEPSFSMEVISKKNMVDVYIIYLVISEK